MNQREVSSPDDMKTGTQSKSPQVMSFCGSAELIVQNIFFANTFPLNQGEEMSGELMAGHHNCFMCLEGFETLSALNLHICREHTKRKACICPVCDAVFVRPSILKHHSYTHWRDTAPDTYDPCEGSASYDRSYKSDEFRHQRAAECAFTCIQCDERFSTHSGLERHCKMHSGQDTDPHRDLHVFHPRGGTQ